MVTTDPPTFWEEGPFLVIERGSDLAGYCICCGSPASAKRFESRIGWHPAYWYLALALGVVPYFLVEWVATRRATVRYRLCDHHRRHRRKLLLIFWGTTILSLAILMFSFVVESTVGFFVSVSIFAAFACYWQYFSIRLVHRIDSEHIWLRKQHLAMLPAISQWGGLK